MSQSHAIIAAKKRLRSEALAARRAGRTANGEAAARLAGLADQLAIAPGTVVAGYWPMADELDPRPLMLRLAEAGCRLALPVVVERGHRLAFRAWTPGDELEPGDHGTFHPFATAPALVPAVVLVPLLAFDRQGFRLGYGGGYYDRTLESLRAKAHVRTIGIALAAQEVEIGRAHV